MVSVIIPAYKNTDELVQNLRQNLIYLKDCEVIVVNNNPEKSIKTELKDFDLVLVENEKNLGFAGAVNAGVEKAKGKYIMLLNSDVILNDSSYSKALKHFEDNDALFGVSFLQKEVDEKKVGKNTIFWDYGLVKHNAAETMDSGITAWAEGGTSIFDKEKFLKLGGFDTLYSPFYWEDIDLSYRAWKAGFEVLFDSSIIVTHHHEGTIGKYFDSRKVKKIAFRNQHIFMIKNITDRGLIFTYWLLLIPNFIYYFLKREPLFISGFLEAFGKIKKITEQRQKQMKSFILQDSKILSKFK